MKSNVRIGSPVSQNSDALAFKATRSHHSHEAAEDYCELILKILETRREARTCDIAKRLGISHVTAIRTLKRLQLEGYIKTSPRRPVTLTQKGRKTAFFAKERHLLLVEFLVRIGVPRDLAEIDIEGAEHHFSEVTLASIRSFMEKDISL